MRTLVLLVVLCVASAGQAEILRGVVLREDGRPAPGAAVTAGAVFKSPPLRLTASADEQGAFQIDLPRLTGSARFVLAIRWQNQGAQVSRAADENGKSATITGQPLTPITVRLQQEGRLRGRLLQLEDNAPIADARLFLDTGEVLTTNAVGEFEVSGLPMKDHSLIPVASGRVRQYVLFDTTHRANAELDLRLPRGAIIKGKVTDERGEPIPGAFLTRASSGTALTLSGWNEVCSADGSFEYGGLSTKRLFYNLTAKAPGYAAEKISAEVHQSPQVIVRDVQLAKRPGFVAAERGGTASTPNPPKGSVAELPRRVVKGTVLGEDGKAVAGAEVRWGAFCWDRSVESTMTNAEGRFTLKNVPEGKGAVLVIADGRAPQFSTIHSQAAVDVVLSRGTRVRGVVRGTSGKPVSNAQITMVTHCLETGYCNPIWLDERSARTNEQGEFEIAALPREGVRFDILKAGYSEQRDVSLRMDGSLNEIQLQAGGAVAGLIVDENGNAVRNFSIRVKIPRERRAGEQVGGYYAGFNWYGITFTRDDGKFTFTDIGADHWMRLIVSSPGVGCSVLDRVQSHALDQLPPAENLAIQLRPFSPLHVKVVDARKGTPLPDALVSLLEDEPDFSSGFNWGYHDLWSTRARTDASGTAVFREPECEDGTVTVSTPGFARKRITWNDVSRTMTIRLEPEASITGEVRMEGRAVGEGFVQLRSAENENYSFDLASGLGKFEFEQLAAGEYELTVSNRAQRIHREQIMLQPQVQKTVAIAIAKPVE